MKNKQLKIGAMISYISIAVNILVGLIYTPWMVKKIGESQYGIYTLANSLISLFLVDFGLSSAVGRFVSNYHAQNDEKSIGNFLGVVYKLYLMVDAFIFAILLIIFLFLDKIYVSLTPEELHQFRIVYIIAACSSLIGLPFVTFNGILTAYEKFIQLKLADLIYRTIIVLFTVIALANGFGLYALVLINALSSIIVILYKYTVIKTTTKLKVNFKHKDPNLFKEISVFSIWVTVTTLSQRLIFNISPSILGIVANTTAIAIFGVITTIEQYSYLITTAINGMFMPQISHIYAENREKEDLMPLMIKIGKYNIALIGIIVIGFVLVGKPFILLWMGESYVAAYLGIILVISPALIYYPLQVGITALTVKGKVKIQAIISLSSGLINVALSFVLSYFLGVIGACVSICVVYCFRGICYHIAEKKILNLDIKAFMLENYVKVIPVFAITLVFGYFLQRIISINSWFMLFIAIILIALVYGILFLTFALKKEDRLNIFRKLKSIFKINRR